jgi:hypothetical protein
MGFRRVLVAVLGLAIAAQAVALCGATGWERVTRFPSDDLARMNQSTDFEKSFAPTGLNDRLGPLGKIESRFAFGWLPYPTWGREALSVATVGGPGAALVLIGLWPDRRRRSPATEPSIGQNQGDRA